jgi:hypothetical protein
MYRETPAKKTSAPNRAADAANQSSIAAPTPAITSRNGNNSSTTATTVIPSISCSRITAISEFAANRRLAHTKSKFAAGAHLLIDTTQSFRSRHILALTTIKAG